MLEWIPTKSGRFVKPADACRADLLEGFTYDASYRWLESVHFGATEKSNNAAAVELAAKRKALGFSTQEELERTQQFAKLPTEIQRQLLDEYAVRRDVELPERSVRNPELRQSRVAAEARSTGDKAAVMRNRSVQLDVEAAKSEAKVYLTDQYTNSAHQMICQACKNELPFRLPNGSYYFEAVETFHDTTKRLRESYLCLCPNHAAAYKYANAQKNLMRELVAQANGTEIEVSLGGKELTLYFTQVHIGDLQACLSAEDEVV